MSSNTLPSHDFYQNPTHLTLSIYIKGYGGEGIKDQVKVEFEQRKITINLPSLPSVAESRIISFDPLFDEIKAGECTARVLNTKIEIKLSKSSPINWPTLLSDPSKPPTNITSSIPVSSSSIPTQNAGSSSSIQPLENSTKPKVDKKKNWDKLLESELEEKEDNKDPNAGGDAALQKFFSQIYGNANEDTKRAMIKSFTESGGTTLSTDWNSIGKETTPVRPPEGMEQKKM